MRLRLWPFATTKYIQLQQCYFTYIYSVQVKSQTYLCFFLLLINHRKMMPFISLSNSSRSIYEPTLVLNTAALCVKKLFEIKSEYEHSLTLNLTHHLATFLSFQMVYNVFLRENEPVLLFFWGRSPDPV